MNAAATPRRAITPQLAQLPDLERKRAHAEWPFEVGLVPLADLIVDDRYQRPVHQQFVAEMAHSFDETLVGTIDVSQRRNGGYAVLDGQQRYMAMSQVGKTACWCSIYDNMTIADEAAFFYRKNRDRRAMKAYYGFRARVMAGDDDAVEIAKIVDDAGYVMGPHTNDHEVIGATNAIELVWGYASAHRDESLTATLKTLRAAYFGRKGSLSSDVLLGVGRFWQTFPDSAVKKTLLRDALDQFGGPGNMIGVGRDKWVVTAGQHRRSLPMAVARAIVDGYNKKARAAGSARLDVRQVG